jgi:hypothetical protein
LCISIIYFISMPQFLSMRIKKSIKEFSNHKLIKELICIKSIP